MRFSFQKHHSCNYCFRVGRHASPQGALRDPGLCCATLGMGVSKQKNCFFASPTAFLGNSERFLAPFLRR